MFHLPKDIINLIYEFDNTFRFNIDVIIYTIDMLSSNHNNHLLYENYKYGNRHVKPRFIDYIVYNKYFI